MSRISNSAPGRLIIVLFWILAIPAAVHVAARLIYNLVMIRSFPFLYGYKDYTGSTTAHWPPALSWTVTNIPDGAQAHLGGVLAVMAVGVLLWGGRQLLRYVTHGKNKYVDPCQNPRACPCPRHRKEEANARAAQIAAAAAVTAAITTTTINS